MTPTLYKIHVIFTPQHEEIALHPHVHPCLTAIADWTLCSAPIDPNLGVEVSYRASLPNVAPRQINIATSPVPALFLIKTIYERYMNRLGFYIRIGICKWCGWVWFVYIVSSGTTAHVLYLWRCASRRVSILNNRTFRSQAFPNCLFACEPLPNIRREEGGANVSANIYLNRAKHNRYPCKEFEYILDNNQRKRALKLLINKYTPKTWKNITLDDVIQGKQVNMNHVIS